MNRASQQMLNNLGIPLTAHEVIDASARNPDISDNATVRPVNRFICDSFAIQ